MKDISKQFLIESEKNLRAIVMPSEDDLFGDSSSFFDGENAIIDLFTQFSSFEIDDINQILDSTDEFFDFLMSTKTYQTDRLVKKAIDQARRSLRRDMRVFFHESKFANTVYELSPTSPQNSHILDVGPGEVPYSSLVLATETKKVSAMDKSFLFSIESLKQMNVNAFNTYFDQNTNIDDYDFVVGSCPCTAIPYIVDKCVKQNKPYFILLCDCATYSTQIPIMNDFAMQKKFTWNQILPELDPNIKFYDDYAFNLDASPEQVKAVIEQVNDPYTQNKLKSIKPRRLILDEPDTLVLKPTSNGYEWVKE